MLFFPVSGLMLHVNPHVKLAVGTSAHRHVLFFHSPSFVGVDEYVSLIRVRPSWLYGWNLDRLRCAFDLDGHSGSRAARERFRDWHDDHLKYFNVDEIWPYNPILSTSGFSFSLIVSLLCTSLLDWNRRELWHRADGGKKDDSENQCDSGP